MKKKILASLLAFCLLISGCSSTNESKNKEPKKTKGTSKSQEATADEDDDSNSSTTDNIDEDKYIEEFSLDNYDITPSTLYSIEDLKENEATSDLFFTDLNVQRSPKKLLVVLMNYEDCSLEGDDEEIEKIWADYIFGSPNNEEDEYSVNDYFLEVSNGNFWYEPVLLGDNTTGVYSFHFDKEYSSDQGVHPEYSFFEFDYDSAHALDELSELGLDISDFQAVGINNRNYQDVLINFFDSSQDDRPSEWYDTDTVMLIYPPYNWENTDLTPLSADFDKYGLYTHINFDSPYGTFVHELCHTLGAVDVYNYGYFTNDLMSHGYDLEDTFDTSHIDPYYKMIWGWTDVQFCQNEGTYVLYPQSSDDYSPLLVTTDNPNQYYLIEYRDGTGFDSYIGEENIGITIWRIDKLALQEIYSSERRGIDLAAILNEADQSTALMYYKDFDNVNDSEFTESGVTVECNYIGSELAIVTVNHN